MLAVRVRVRVKSKVRERQAEHDLKLWIRKLEIEADKEVKLRQLEMGAMGISSGQTAHGFEKPVPSQSSCQNQSFDVSRHIVLVPVF